MPDIADTVTDLTAVIAPIGVLAAGFLLFAVGARIVRRYIK